MAASLGEFVPLLNGREDFFGVLGRLHVRPYFSYSSIWSNKNGDTVRAHIFAAHKTFLAPNAVSLHNPLVFVGDQDKGQLKFVYKFIMSFHRIGTDSQHDCV